MSAAGPWNYDDPPTDGSKLLVQFPAEYIFDQITCVIHWDENSESIYGKPMCWSEINMPEGREE